MPISSKVSSPPPHAPDKNHTPPQKAEANVPNSWRTRLISFIHNFGRRLVGTNVAEFFKGNRNHNPTSRFPWRIKHVTDPKQAKQMLARQQQRDNPEHYLPQHKSSKNKQQVSASEMRPMRVRGAGGFGQVTSVKPKTAGPIRVQKSFRSENEANYERNMLLNLDHPNIIKAVETKGRKTPSDKFYMEDGGATLKLYIKGQEFEEENPVRIDGGPIKTAALTSCMRQILSALDYLRDQNIAHRDIKPENVLINPGNGQVKVADFGVAVKVDNNALPTRTMGTLGYLAPEIMGNVLRKQDQDKTGYGVEVDMFSAGCLFYWLVTGGDNYLPKPNNPLINCHCQEAMKQIRDRDVHTFMHDKAQNNDFATEPHNQQQIAELLAGMLEIDPKKRLTPTQAQEIVARITPEPKLNSEQSPSPASGPATPLPSGSDCQDQ